MIPFESNDYKKTFMKSGSVNYVKRCNYFLLNLLVSNLKHIKIGLTSRMNKNLRDKTYTNLRLKFYLIDSSIKS